MAPYPTNCPHCLTKPTNLDMHLRFDCPVIRPKEVLDTARATR